MPTTTNNTTNNSGRIGPRARCDQVVYEAIAKAAEIIVRSRCPPYSLERLNHQGNNEWYHNSETGKRGATSTSSRFNIEVEEVSQVRSVLQRWRRSLHVPLRLDVFYQHPGENQQQELLERWCIDYVESSSGMEGKEDILAQLRQVCKRVVTLLRTLHCLARMLPAFRLYRRLCSSQRRESGYYPTDSMEEGTIGFSFYASGSHHEADNPSFVRHNFTAVPTPYGVLHVCALYAPNLTLPRFATVEMTALETPVPVQREVQEPTTPVAESPPSGGVSDFIIQDYAESRENGVESSRNKETKGEVGNRVLSGLSLALMNDNLTAQPNPPPPPAEPPSPRQSAPTLLRMHSLDERYNKWNRPESKDPFPVACSASPKRYISRHLSRTSFTDPDVALSGEYGYAYNNITIKEKSAPSRPIRIQNAQTRGRSPNRLSSTPPFSQSPASAVKLSPPISSSPPFSVNPVSLDRKERTDGNAHDILLPPSSLEVLRASPFKAPFDHSLVSSLAASCAPFDEAPFTGSFGSTSVTAAVSDEDMPFATADSSVFGDASSFAHKCSTAGRLQIFETKRDDVDDLVNQLEGFRSFGASLSYASGGGSGSSQPSLAC